MHTLLRRQLRRFAIAVEALPPEYAGLLDAASEAYDAFDTDRLTLERALEISSQELIGINESIRSSRAVLSAVLDSTADGILAVHLDGHVVHSNARFAELWQIPQELLNRRDDAALLDFVIDQLADPGTFLRKVQELYQSLAESLDTIEFRDGRLFERYSRPLLDDDEIAGRVWSFRDVTARKELEQQLRHQALHDPLTGLANRVLFADRLTQALERSRRVGQTVAVLFVDVDNFKSINDAFGHAAGDELLVAIGRRIEDLLRPGDTVARFGGDEFTFLMEDLTPDEACAFGDEIMAALRPPFQIAERAVSVQVSIGIATGGADKATADGMMRDADAAMYAAKSHGRARVELYDEKMHSAVHDRLQLVSEIRPAIALGQFIVQYQPVFNLASGELVGLEALVRWNHPERGTIPPLEFIPLAEECGAMPALGEWVLREACAQLKRWQTEHPQEPPLHVAVNVSSRQLQPELVKTVRAPSPTLASNRPRWYSR